MATMCIGLWALTYSHQAHLSSLSAMILLHFSLFNHIVCCYFCCCYCCPLERIKIQKKNPLLFIDALPFIFIVIVRWRVIRDYDMMMWIFVGCDCTDPSLIHFFFCLMSDSKIILLDHLRRTMDRDRMLMSGRAAHHHHQTEIH